MKTQELIDLGLELNKRKNRFIMPWDGELNITDDMQLTDIMQHCYDVGKDIGKDEGKLIGAKKIQLQFKRLLNNPYEGL